MFDTILNSLTSTAFWFQVLACTTPVLLATLGANIIHQTGLFNLGIEGTMLICALTGVLGGAYSHSLTIGMLCGVLSGVLISLVLGYFTLVMKGSMNACGVAINLLASGGTVFVLSIVTGSKVTSASLQSLSFPALQIPFLDSIPVLGNIVSGHNVITYLSWLVESVKDKGVTQPAIVRPREDDGYEIVSGHRRQKASELAGFVDMPCIIRNLMDEQAIMQMVEDNTNQRENILPNERAKALKMQLEAIKRQGRGTATGSVPTRSWPSATK